MVGHLVRRIAALERAYSPGHHGRWSARRRASLVDQAVAALAEGLGPGVAVVAVGGYGRSLLCPGSDIDLLVLHEEPGPEGLEEAARQLFYPFWDAGLPLGHAVRTVEECEALGKDRLDVLTSLLDARQVAGDPGPFRSLGRVVSALVADRSAAVERLGAGLEERHARHGSCSQLLEPDLKESSGGLRDVHAVGWLGRVVAGGSDPRRLERGGLLRRPEAAALDDAEEFLVRLRSALHLETGRRGDRVWLEHQPRLAEAFGFEATAGLRAPDALMRALFEHARAVEHVTEAVFDRAAASLGAGPGHLEVGAAGPEDVLGAFRRMAETGTPLSAASLDALEGSVVGSPRWTEGCRSQFLAILAAGEGGARALEAMDRAGVLERFLPEWGAVRCRPQRDPYHRYTVDVHLVRTAANAARLLAGEDVAPGDALAREAAGAVPDRDALLLGALLHDIGKTGEGPHVPVGVRVAGSALARMGVPSPTAEDAAFLVEHHLLLSDTATRRDLSDENLVLDVAAAVRDPGRLAMLYLLTVADGLATGPQAWTPWRQALVGDLVGKVHRVLERRAMEPDRAALIRGRSDRVRDLLAGEDPAAVEAYLARLPRAYLAAMPPEAAVRHFPLVSPPLAADEVRTAATAAGGGAHEVTVVAPDRPGLLALIAGSLALAGLNILSARAFTTEDGVAVDVFLVEPAFGGDVDEERWRGVRTDLRRAMAGRISLDHRVREKRRHYPAPRGEVPLRVTVDNDASDFFSVVEVSAPDRIGLLYDLTRGLEEAGLDVHLAVVATYAGRVVDSFYVRDLVGEKLLDPERIAEVERAVLRRIASEGREG